MVTAKKVKTSRLEVHYLESGNIGKDIVVLLHGNVSSSVFFKPLLENLPANYHYIAPDMRGFGDSETKAVDATKGVKDFSDDLKSLLDIINKDQRKVHLLGWSAGAGVIMQYVMDYPSTLIASITLQAPMSPFGFGGSRNTGIDLELCATDYAGSGGGTANPQFVDCLRTNDGKFESVQPEAMRCTLQSHARTTMNTFYFKMIDNQTLLQRGIIDQTTEDMLTKAMFTTKLGDGNYPGDFISSSNWPGVAPGTKGMNNAISPQYCNLSGFASKGLKIPLLWIRGIDDQIVSDTSFFDFNYLGSLGYVPGWPGNATHPPQPMIAQMRAVLELYKQNGGNYKECVLADCGHSPHIEKQSEFLREFLTFLKDK